jgi:ABC-2 type transport system ATP-binding protein
MSLLQAQDLHFAYAGEAPLIAGWTGAVATGVTLLYGDTGTGKSTLLRIFAGVEPAHGQLTVAGVRLDQNGEAYRRNVFFVDPVTDRFDAISGRACTSTLRDGDAGFNEALWRALVDGLSLAPHIDKPMYMLSTGSKRKVWLAAALASSRPVALIDDPTYGLDAPSRRCLWQALTDIAGSAQRAVVIASSERLDTVPWTATIEQPLRA